MKTNSAASIVSDITLIVMKVKQRSERRQRSPFNRSQVKQRNECSQ